MVRHEHAGADTYDMTALAAYWPVPRLEAVLPNGIPSGALTLIELGTRSAVGSWECGVLDLLRDMVALGRPALYVNCGAVEPGCAQGVAATIGSPLVAGFEDEDLTVMAPSPYMTITGSDAPAYDCRIPTLHRLAPALADLEEAHCHGAALLLDDVASARPYWAACEQEQDLRLPDNFTLERREADAWRAVQMAEIAESRPLSPTIVVWHRRRDDAGLQQMRDVALVRLVVIASLRVSVAAYERRAVLQEYQKVRQMQLPR